MRGKYSSLLTGTSLSFGTATYIMSDERTHCSGIITDERTTNNNGVSEADIATKIFNNESFMSQTGKSKKKRIPFSKAINSVSGPDRFWRRGFFAEGESRDVVIEIMEAFAQSMIKHGCTRGEDS